ncbi:hypothetical protein EV183_001644 [Coemansia sp. RSA 2336]|nr:hypothetical protein EV183_001644 [Coemansia sp. RSA 2336]
MYKSRYLAILPLLAFALVAFASEYSDDSFSDSVTADLPDSSYDEATTASNHIRDAVSTDPHELLAGLLRNLQSSPAASPTMDPSATDQVEGFDRHKHKKHKHHKCKDVDEDDDNDKKKPCCKKCPMPTYHISLNCEDEKYKTISLPAQGRPFEYGEDVRHSLPPLVKSDCCQKYCYDPCCQPTCAATMPTASAMSSSLWVSSLRVPTTLWMPSSLRLPTSLRLSTTPLRLSTTAMRMPAALWLPTASMRLLPTTSVYLRPVMRQTPA